MLRLEEIGITRTMSRSTTSCERGLFDRTHTYGRREPTPSTEKDPGRSSYLVNRIDETLQAHWLPAVFDNAITQIVSYEETKSGCFNWMASCMNVKRNLAVSKLHELVEELGYQHSRQPLDHCASICDPHPRITRTSRRTVSNKRDLSDRVPRP